MYRLATLLVLLLSGCTMREPKELPPSFTLGNVQRSIQIGMGQTQVLEALGSPNIVTKDQEGAESWVYDRIATAITERNAQSGVWMILFAGANEQSSAQRTTQTLTVVVKFDAQGLVQKVSYHMSRY